MFFPAEKVQNESVVSCDLCIIGSGAAGLTLGRELLGSDLRVAILESGGLEAAPSPDALYDLECANLSVAPHSRVRAFGGTTTVWAGRWKPHDEIDFLPREWVPLSGWPFQRETLLPYYERAATVLRISSPGPIPGRGWPSPILEPTVFAFQQGRGRNWGAASRKAFASAPGTSVYLGAHVVRLARSKEAVQHAEVRTLSGTSFRVEARNFVLAAGAIENARLLLLSDLGNEHDQVGRYYTDHPKATAGVIEAYRPVDFSTSWAFVSRDGSSQVGLRLSDAAQKDHGILNSQIFLQPLREQSLFRKLTRSKATYLVELRNFMEQAPCPSNRVTLGLDQDVFGCAKARVDWSLTELDRKTMVVFHQLLSRECQRLKIGELRSPLLRGGTADFPITKDASHHTGTTRMGMDPATSVVDPDCRVHGVPNLYVAGTSVFPTGGYANPVATIAALAVRLADHLKRTS